MGVLTISRANCKNCYKCIRTCPVKAIKIKNDQAEIIEERCVQCGKCVKVCPLEAKKVNTDLDELKKSIKEGETVIASIAPSFLSILEYDPKAIEGFLKHKGITEVHETAFGAQLVSNEYNKLLDNNKNKNIIATACPAINHLVQKYYPKIIHKLAPLVSPMVAHGKYLKEIYGSFAKVVFIGPCVGKIAEAKENEVKGVIDYVITFEELINWIKEEEGKIEEPEFLNNKKAPGKARFFALPGGMFKTLGREKELYTTKALYVEGIDECLKALKAIEENQIEADFIEMLACDGGCVGGPMNKGNESFLVRKQAYLKHAGQIPNAKMDEIDFEIDLGRKFEQIELNYLIPNQSIVKEILSTIGKTSESDEINCGSCGYSTCREKAVAVYQGMAELDMCIPYMRDKAESLSNLVIQATPNGIILTDHKLEIQEFNPAAERIFDIKRKDILNKKLDILIDDKYFLRVLKNQNNIENKKVIYDELNLVTVQSIKFIPGENLILGIITDITEEEKNQQKANKIRVETVNKAKKVIDKQMTVAQEIAGLLGETTAESKVLLTKLIEQMEKGEDGK